MASICRRTIVATTSHGQTPPATTSADDYWIGLYRWYAHGGHEIVAHHLADHDLTGFDPKAPPTQTEAFWEIVDAGHAPENAELLTVLEERLKWPAAVTIDMIKVQQLRPDADRMARRSQEPQGRSHTASKIAATCASITPTVSRDCGVSTASSRPSTPAAICLSASACRPRENYDPDTESTEGTDGTGFATPSTETKKVGLPNTDRSRARGGHAREKWRNQCH